MRIPTPPTRYVYGRWSRRFTYSDGRLFALMDTPTGATAPQVTQWGAVCKVGARLAAIYVLTEVACGRDGR